MALKDSLKKIDFAKATDVVSSVTNSITHTFDKLKSKDDKTDEQTIDSVDSLSCYLQSLQSDASPAVMMALQSQLSVLKYVQSPTMMLMAVDNIMLCLHKALKSAEDETTKENLKETFTSLLQSFIFAMEAKLRYEVDNAREESVQLLAEAGDLLMSSVASTAMMVVPMAAGQKVGHVLPKMVNVFAQNTEQKSFIGRLIMVKGKKAMMEEKKAEFDKTLNYIFEELDNYSVLVGPSIQLHGMLKRYADGLIERYAITQYESVKNQINDKESVRLDSFVDTMLGQNDTTVKIKTLFKTVSQVAKSQTLHDYESIRNIKRSLQSELKNYDNQMEKLDVEIAGLEAELNKTSLLQISRKGELQRAISAHKAERARIDQAAMEYRNKLTVVSDIVDPINEKIENYTNNLYRIVEKYKYVV